MCFFRDFFTEILRALMRIAGKSTRYAAGRKNGRNAWQQWLTLTRASCDGEILGENPHAAGVGVAVNLSAQSFVDPCAP